MKKWLSDRERKTGKERDKERETEEEKTKKNKRGDSIRKMDRWGKYTQEYWGNRNQGT